MNIVLIGYRGSGKTLVGKEIAKRLKREFIDCDDYIERKTHLTIKEIFELSGEAYFRDLEMTAIAEVSKLNGKVIATGGGAVLRYKNVQNLKKHGLVFFLDIDYETAYKRIIGDETTASRRPRLTKGSLLDEVKHQIHNRHPYYIKAADFTVPASDIDTDSVADAVITIVSEREDTTHLDL